VVIGADEIGKWLEYPLRFMMTTGGNMKPLRPKQLFSLILSVLILLTAACSQNPNTETAAANQQNNQKVIKVGTSGAYSPFTFLSNGEKLDGYDIEIVNAVAQKMGYQVEWVRGDWNGLVGMLDSGKIDTIANKAAITEERLQKYYFTIPYVYSGAQLVVKKDNDSIKTFDDLKGKKVAVIAGNNYEKMIKDYDKNKEITLVGYEDAGPILNDIALGRVDAYLNDQVVSIVEINKSGLPLKIASDTPLKPVENAYPFLKNERGKALYEEFNKALQELEKDGTLSKLSLKWLSTDVTKKPN
jgi:ABC-type amino acid transport substrate-binding protein